MIILESLWHHFNIIIIFALLGITHIIILHYNMINKIILQWHNYDEMLISLYLSTAGFSKFLSTIVAIVN